MFVDLCGFRLGKTALLEALFPRFFELFWCEIVALRVHDERTPICEHFKYGVSVVATFPVGVHALSVGSALIVPSVLSSLRGGWFPRMYERISYRLSFLVGLYMVRKSDMSPNFARLSLYCRTWQLLLILANQSVKTR